MFIYISYVYYLFICFSKFHCLLLPVVYFVLYWYITIKYGVNIYKVVSICLYDYLQPFNKMRWNKFFWLVHTLLTHLFLFIYLFTLKARERNMRNKSDLNWCRSWTSNSIRGNALKIFCNAAFINISLWKRLENLILF